VAVQNRTRGVFEIGNVTSNKIPGYTKYESSTQANEKRMNSDYQQRNPTRLHNRDEVSRRWLVSREQSTVVHVSCDARREPERAELRQMAPKRRNLAVEAVDAIAQACANAAPR
jgi:hypothetical protein